MNSRSLWNAIFLKLEQTFACECTFLVRFLLAYALFSPISADILHYGECFHPS